MYHFLRESATSELFMTDLQAPTVKIKNIWPIQYNSNILWTRLHEQSYPSPGKGEKQTHELQMGKPERNIMLKGKWKQEHPMNEDQHQAHSPYKQSVSGTKNNIK
jgi:hypothetical protein